MLLAIDTSNDFAGLALWNELGLRGEANWFSGRQHTEQMLAQIDILMQHVQVSTRELVAVAVATGPGSWSGLRAGISLGKSIAIGLGLPMLGVPTLDALAHGYSAADQVVASVRIGRDRFAIGRYVAGPDGMHRVGEFANVGQADVQLSSLDVVLGDLADRRNELTGHGAASLVSPALHHRRAAFVAQIAWSRHQQRDYDDLVTLEPIYLGSPVRTD